MGSHLCIFGAILLTHVVVQPFTHYISLDGSSEDALRSIAQIFRSTAKAITDLQEYYQHLPIGIDPGRLWPCPTLVSDDAPLPFTLKFESKLPTDTCDRNNVFFAFKDGTEQVVVKFTASYGEQAHRCLASAGLAPELHFCGRVCGGMWMVVTAFVDGRTLHGAFGDRSISVYVFQEVQRAVTLLHKQDLVHGDLRRPNVMLIKPDDDDVNMDGTESKPQVMLIDFDWAGKDGEARYPAALNDRMNIDWAPGVERAGLMRKAHDEYMLDRL